MPTANARKGSETERMVARYLREQGFWMADRRLREGRHDDMGDIDGVPYTTIQVKYVAQNRLQSWISDTIKQRDTAGTPLCMLVVRLRGKRPEAWSAYMPAQQVFGEAVFGEEWAYGWMRMDLVLGVAILRRLTTKMQGSLDPSLPTTLTDSTPNGESEACSTVPSTENDEPRSPST